MVDHKLIIEDLTRWIDLNLDPKLNIEIIATRSGYTKWHIQRMFRKINHVSMIHYIRTRLLEKAAIEITKNNDNISEIAKRYGFSSQQSFNRAFKRSFNITPGAYRTCIKYNIFPTCKNKCISTNVYNEISYHITYHFMDFISHKNYF